MFGLFGKRKTTAQPSATITTNQQPVQTSPPVKEKSEVPASAIAGPDIPQAEPRVATLDTPAVENQVATDTEQAQQAVAVLEPPPPPVVKPRQLTEREKIDAEAISFPDICTTLTTSVTPRDPQVIEAEMAALDARLKRTYACEAEYRALLTKDIDARKVELGQVELDRDYRRIDMGFLQRRKWSSKHSCPLPLFAAFGLNDPECLIEIEYNRPDDWGQGGEILTCKPVVVKGLIYMESLKSKAKHIFDEEMRRSYHRNQVKVKLSIQAIFTGAIPEATRDKIEVARTKFDELFLITEAPEWQLEAKVTSVPIPTRDPLVIGRKGKLFWLVDAFDLTPLEAAIKGEWTSDKSDPAQS